MALAPVGQKPPLGVFFGLRSPGQIGNPQILEDIEVDGAVGHEGMAGLMGIVMTDFLFVPLILGDFPLDFLAILRPFLAPGRPPLPFCPY